MCNGLSLEKKRFAGRGNARSEKKLKRRLSVVICYSNQYEVGVDPHIRERYKFCEQIDKMEENSKKANHVIIFLKNL